jgi:hypothetical protein
MVKMIFRIVPIVSELGESGFAATAVASPSDGAGAHAHHEPTASRVLNEGLRCKKKLWREAGREQLEAFPLVPWASRRRRDLLEVLDRLNPTLAELSQAIEQEAEKCPAAERLRTHPGVGSLTALAFVLIIGTADRFQCGKQIASYLGLVPSEESSGDSRRLGTYQQARQRAAAFPAGEAAQVTVRSPSGMAQQVFSPGDATRAEDCEGSDGPQVSHSAVLDDAPGMGLRAGEQIRSARGTDRNRPWCALEHRVIDWASRSSSPEEFELRIVIAVATEEMRGSD